MRRSLLALSLLAGLSAPVLAAPALPTVAKADMRSVWLVQFAEEPLASYRGPGTGAAGKGLGALAATSPAVTGAERLDVSMPAAKAYRQALAQQRQSRLAEAEGRLGRALEPLFVYEITSNGVALELTEAEARMLADVDGVVAVRPDFVREPQTDSGPGWIRADALWEGPNGGNRGEGQVIAIIDTGINSTHPSFAAMAGEYTHQNPRPGFLGLCADSESAGCNSKLIGIYDFTDDENSDEDDDGSDVAGHGSHVAAIAAGNPLSLTSSEGAYSVSGVAPHANLISYKACEEEAKCRGSWLLKALDQAVADRVDVINYSIGGDGRDPWGYSDSMAMLRAREAGVAVVVAAGNDGPLPGSHSAPGNAPWVLGVANISHDRARVSQVTLSGGASAPPNGGVLYGASQTTTAHGPAPIVYAGDHGSALCAAGPNHDALPPDTSTSPWTGQVFNDQIVVCDRGAYARVIKGLNVRNAGGGGMLLVNQAAEGEQVVADQHALPASHLGYADGAALKAWLRSGSGHRATISSSQNRRLASFGDILSASSGRGPIDGDWLKPNLAAPGSSILSAYAGAENAMAFASGTSMAAPHVAGAVALLRKAHPHWKPDQIESALQTTARATVRMPDGSTPAGALDAGAGTVDLSRAVNAALYFPVTGEQFRRANPAQEGDPATLNLPALVNASCLNSCSFTRTVTDMGGGGAWTVQAQMSAGRLSVSPQRFTLASGASQTLTFTYEVGDQARYNTWAEGAVTLQSEDGSRPDATLPVAIYPYGGDLPERIEHNQALESGWLDVGLSGLVALPSARFSASDLVQPLQARVGLPQDETPSERYDGLSSADLGKKFFYVDASKAGLVRFRAEAASATASDIDLFVGIATSADALPSEETEICSSTSPIADEVCEFEREVPAGTRFWVLLQNWQASAAGDDVTLTAAAIPFSPTQTEPAQQRLRVSGPGRTPAHQSFDLRISWDDPGFAPGQARWGHVFIGPDAERATDLGAVLVKLQRPASLNSAAALLLPGTAREMRLAPGQALDRLYIDVPDNASALVLTRRSENIELHLRHVAAPTTPGIQTAPERGSSDAHVLRPGAPETLRISGADLKPGRWYITPVNTGSSVADLWLQADLEYQSAPTRPAFGNWYNPARSGSGFQLAAAAQGTAWSVAWYTYLQDGTPTWYLGTGPAPQGQQGHVVFNINRFAWDGRSARAVEVGQGLLSFVNADTLRFSWNLDGESGSETVRLVGNGSCLALDGARKIDGNWYESARPGYGYDINSYTGIEAILAYLYDGLGQPRWLQGSANRSPTLGQQATLELIQRQGACPLCRYSGNYGTTPVGALTRRYASADTGQIGVQAAFAAPLSGQWSQQGEARRLTEPQYCP